VKIHLQGVKLRKPRTSYEKDEEAEAGVAPLTTLTVEVADMDAEDVMTLARYAAYGLPLEVTFQSPQKEMFEAALRVGEVANG
jgi:thiol:disulfide interchange protein